jgi:hypothetical protein
VKVRLQRVGILAAMGVVTLNIWTGAPLLGLWVGSRVAPDSGISMLAVFVIAVVIGATAWADCRSCTRAWAGTPWPAARRRG